jgi:hypothetical protein
MQAVLVKHTFTATAVLILLQLSTGPLPITVPP